MIKAVYGGLDVSSIVQSYIDSSKELVVCNDIFTDPKPGVVKTLDVTLEDCDGVHEYSLMEYETFIYPVRKIDKIPTILITSCDRIEQVLLSISLNCLVINTNFNLVFVDCSTVFDTKKVEDHIRSKSNIVEYKIIHVTPTMEKHAGDDALVRIGLFASLLFDSDFVLKLSGVCVLKKDPFFLSKILGDNTILTFVRDNQKEVRSSRIFACCPKELCRVLLKVDYSIMVKRFGFYELRFMDIIDEHCYSSVHTGEEEHNIMYPINTIDVNTTRNCIEKVLTDSNFSDSYIDKFKMGGIWV